MPSALKQLGIRKAIKFFYTTFLAIIYKFMIFPQMRSAFLRLCGAKIGKGTIICGGVRFINLYRTGFKGLTIGSYCWISEEAMFDLADRITFGDHVSFGQRSMIFTHSNVGYKEHPLQKYYHPYQKPVVIQNGAAISVCCVILAGATVGERSMVIMNSVVSANRNVPSGVLYGGNPGRIIKVFEEIPPQNINE
jgi:acetyltransferase-like isoleucine patch superfamily enzyme